MGLDINLSASDIYLQQRADWGKYARIEKSGLSALGYPIDGPDKFAVFTYELNPPIISISSDIINVSAGDASKANQTVIIGQLNTVISKLSSSLPTISANGMPVNVLAPIDLGYINGIATENTLSAISIKIPSLSAGRIPVNVVFPATQTVNGTVSANVTFPTNQTVSGTITAVPSNEDAFHRERVSLPVTIFDSKFLYDGNPLYWSTYLSGNAVSSHSVNTASVTLSTGSLTNAVALRQTKRRWNYQPGKSQMVVMTGVFGSPQTGITKRMGLFDDNNGLFWGVDQTGLFVGIRSSTTGSPVENVVYQSNWNGDKLNGTGSSGVTLDPTKANIYMFDFQWLGAGKVRFSISYNGHGIIVAHTFLNANLLPTVYMSTPNLPLRYSIRNNGTGAPSQITQICSSIITEGHEDLNGIVYSVNRGVTGFATLNNNAVFPLLSIKLRPERLSSSILPKRITIINTTTAAYRWVILLNPTIVGTDNASYQTLQNTSVQYDVSRTNQVTLTGGFELACGYGSSSLNEMVVDLDTVLSLGATYPSILDEIILGVSQLGNQAETFYGSMTLRELN